MPPTVRRNRVEQPSLERYYESIEILDPCFLVVHHLRHTLRILPTKRL